MPNVSLGTNYKLFIFYSATTGYQRSLYIQQLLSTSKLILTNDSISWCGGLNQHHHATQSHYPDTDPASRCPIIIMPSARLGSDKYQFWSHCFDSTRVQTHRVKILTRKIQIPWSPGMGGGCSTHSATPFSTKTGSDKYNILSNSFDIAGFEMHNKANQFIQAQKVCPLY